MIELTLVVIGLLVISFTCSVLESIILSISRPYIQLLVDKKMRSGRILQELKHDIDKPISAILTLNTISHTVGAAVSGAMALSIFGSKWMALFSAVLTILILVFSEIIPKTIGAYYWKSLSPASAYILKTLIFILKPLIIPINFFSGLFMRENPASLVSKAEIYNYILMGYKQGALGASEFEIIENLFNLRDIKVKDIMTPRTVVFWLEQDLSIIDLHKDKTKLDFSRIPLYDPHKNAITGIVLRRDIMDKIAEKKMDTALKKISKKPEFVPESISVLNLLNNLVSKRTHLAIVLNEYGDYNGIVTIEDAVEALLGTEIVDEFDPAVNMRELARKKGKKRNEVATADSGILYDLTKD